RWSRWASSSSSSLSSCWRSHVTCCCACSCGQVSPMTDIVQTAQSALYAGRRRRNAIAKALAVAATAFGLGWLVLILGVLIYSGIGGLSLAVFTENTPPPGSAGGLANAIFGSVLMTVLAVLIGTPIGILAGTYMAEYGRHDKLTSVVRFINDIL